MFYPNCGTSTPAGQSVCSNCGTAVMHQQPITDIFSQQPYAPRMSMGWYKFLIYFCLWVGAILTFITGISYLFGFQQGGMTDCAFAVYSVEQFFVDTIYGIVCIALGIFMIVTRFRLARFRANALALLYCVYALNTVIPLLYILATSAVTMLPLSWLFDAQTISMIVVSVAMIVINVIYFRKRREMFVR